MPDPATFAVFLPAALLLGASPGANNLLALTTAARHGGGVAARALAGRLAAFAVLIALVALGLDRLLAAWELAFQALKWGGIAYLLWIAWTYWRAEPVVRDTAPVKETHLARREFVTLMANPKAYLLLTAFLPQFTDPSHAFLPQMAVLGALYVGAEGIAALAWIGAGGLLGAGAMTARRQRLLNRAAAFMLAGAALLLVRAERTA